nr:MAG TPA: hypothetical protein [Caudoviricetes sp.]
MVKLLIKHLPHALPRTTIASIPSIFNWVPTGNSISILNLQKKVRILYISSVHVKKIKNSLHVIRG